MKIAKENCRRCPQYSNKNCDGDAMECMCRRCPRNLGECLTTKYCRETESIIDDYYDGYSY